MNAERRSEGFLSAKAILALLDLVSSPVNVDILCASLRALKGASPIRTVNSVAVLSEIGLVYVENGFVHRGSAGRTGEVELLPWIRAAVATHYASLLSPATVGTAFQMGDDGSLCLDSKQLPFRDRGYVYLILEFGIATRESVTSRFWLLADDMKEPFFAAISKINDEQLKPGAFTLGDLKKVREAQAAAGRSAEQWVVNFERKRLSGHQFIESIQAISDGDAAAGFDVLSFESLRSLLHDRFVEVKSYAEEYSFYWSEEEMAVAKRLGSRYWIYLVDRNRLGDSRYVPEMIPDPYSFFVLDRPSTWEAAATGMKFIGTMGPGQATVASAAPQDLANPRA
jgi:hypothetical protein